MVCDERGWGLMNGISIAISVILVNSGEQFYMILKWRSRNNNLLEPQMYTHQIVHAKQVLYCLNLNHPKDWCHGIVDMLGALPLGINSFNGNIMQDKRLTRHGDGRTINQSYSITTESTIFKNVCSSIINPPIFPCLIGDGIWSSKCVLIICFQILNTY